MKSYVFPGDIDPAIMAIGAEPIPYMRTQAFSDINLESEPRPHRKKGFSLRTGSFFAFLASEWHPL